jgi:protein TonB
MAAQMNAMFRSVPQSIGMAVSAFGLALAAHAVFVLQGSAPMVEQAGGQTALAAQGNSFANLAAGVETPVEADVPEQAAQPAPLQPVMPEATREISPKVTPSAVQPVPVVQQPTPQIETAQGGLPVLVVTPEPDRATPTDPVETLEPAEQVEQTSSVEPLRITEAPPDSVEQRVEPQKTTEPQPVEPQSPAVTQSLRPPERPVDPTVQPQPEPPRRRVEEPARKPVPTTQPRGNGQVNATRGEVQSTRSAPGGQAVTNGGAARVQGNAAASNYPGQVMRRIQRAKRRANVRGVAVVRFKVTAGGGLTGLSIARSSGSAKLDGIALAQVRRAAPFPPPPAGARTSFTVRIKGN